MKLFVDAVFVVKHVGVVLGSLAKVGFEDEGVFVFGGASGVDAVEEGSFFFFDLHGLFAALSVFFVGGVALDAVAALLLEDGEAEDPLIIGDW